MTVVIHLPDRQGAALEAKAWSRGLSLEGFRPQVLAHELEPRAPEPFLETFHESNALFEECFRHLRRLAIRRPAI